METLKKTLYIPANHQVQFNITLPDSFPIGEAEVVLIVAPKTFLAPPGNSQKLLALAGRLKDSPHFKGDPLTLQKELRNEWKN